MGANGAIVYADVIEFIDARCQSNWWIPSDEDLFLAAEICQ